MEGKKPYPYWVVVHEQITKTEGRFKVATESEKDCLNPEFISGKKMWYTTQGGYSHNHPMNIAEERANKIAAVLNMQEEKLPYTEEMLIMEGVQLKSELKEKPTAMCDKIRMFIFGVRYAEKKTITNIKK